MHKKPEIYPMNCTICGRFVGQDGYPNLVYDDWFGGWKAEPVCGRCGRAKGWPDPPAVWRKGEV